uniref:PID domain-containing protein n=1 Tax=Vombatus ursinus TaxID=29139 RepID=A0A4X2KGW9_VOMUR
QVSDTEVGAGLEPLCFVNKPIWGWLHPRNKVMRPGVSYLVRYMGCVEVLQSMRALDFSTCTQVTREAISLVCEAVLGAKVTAWRRKPCSRPLSSILGRSNLKFASMPITLTVSSSSLNLMAADCKQIISNHRMQSISFATGRELDSAEYVIYVVKDPVNQRACHVLECPEGLAQDVISTIGLAFELRFKQYLRNPPNLVTPHDRMADFDGPAWDVEEEEPLTISTTVTSQAKEPPPLGGVLDMRLQDGASPEVPCPPLPSIQTTNHLRATLELFGDPSYVNVQNLEKVQQGDGGSSNPTTIGSAPHDLFDMKPIEDVLRVPHLPLPHQCLSSSEGSPGSMGS